MSPESIGVDRVFAGVGRIKKATGTHQKAVANKIDRMLTALYEDGRLDLLQSVRENQIGLLQLYNAYQRRELDRLPTGPACLPLVEAWGKWLKQKECGPEHKRSLAQSLRHLHAPDGTLVADIVGLLAKARVRLADKPQSFRLLRLACQSFVKHTLRSSHQIYRELQAIEPLRITVKRKGRPMQLPEFLAMVKALPPHAASIAWTMATTGMRVNEMYGTWSVQFDRVLIEGTKTKGAVRVVPLLTDIGKPAIAYQTVRKLLAKAGGIAPYDLRRTYAVWMEAAGIPRTRRKLYLGHMTDDITSLYERHEITAFLADDAARMKAYIAQGQQVLSIAR